MQINSVFLKGADRGGNSNDGGGGGGGVVLGGEIVVGWLHALQQ